MGWCETVAKGKYEKWLTDDGLLQLTAWARDGLTDEQIAHNCGITAKTLYEWKNKFSEICEALKRGKEVVDIEVENALHRKAMGYTVKLMKTFKVKKVEFENGKKLREIEELQTGYDEMHVPADTTAQIYWLNNRKPEVWRTRTEKVVPASEQENNIFDVIEQSTREELETDAIPEIEPPAKPGHDLVE